MSDTQAGTARQEQDELASLSNLEARIHRAVETVTQLRREKDDALAQVRAKQAEKEGVELELLEAQERIEKLTAELDSFREDRRQVRERIERLLGQIDTISAE
jgi:FtsZ-binding cell division protein ZapB